MKFLKKNNKKESWCVFLLGLLFVYLILGILDLLFPRLL